MDTFTEPKALEDNPHFQDQRSKTLDRLNDVMIDKPIIEIVKGFNRLPYCYTLQCCYGHFLYDGQNDPHNLEPLPPAVSDSKVEYRIAYIAFCVENSSAGKSFLEVLGGFAKIDPENIQFCCAEWFWKRYVNSYSLQVEPDRFKDRDVAILDYGEALKIERLRKEFFINLERLLQDEIGRKMT